MAYHVIITDNNGHTLADAEIQADSLLDAGIIAEEICDHYYQEHPNNKHTDFTCNCHVRET